MKHIFIINPAAGNGKAGVKALPEIIASVKNAGVEYEIHRTVNVGDATHYVRERCAEAPDDEIRFYACGGDGTVNEVLNGLIGAKNAQLAIVPVGTGNDFVRNFGDAKQFRDIKSKLEGSPVVVDALKYDCLDQTDQTEEMLAASGIRVFPRTGYAINMFNMGFDAEVVARTVELKRRPLISGTTAYVSGVASVLSKLKKLPLAIEIDGVAVDEGEFLLAGAANGRFSGGGFDGMPLAITNDGVMDVLTVKSVTRRFFLSIVKKYHDGTHVGDKRLDGVLKHYACREAVFRPKRPMVLAIDGETTTTEAVRISAIPSAVKLSLPKALERRAKPKRAHRMAPLCLALALIMLLGSVSPVYGWGNGGTNRTAWQKKNAIAKPNITDAAQFTVNLLPDVSASGAGIGTHDLMLEQAIAQAIYGGADVSWIDVNTARNATAEPDYAGTARTRFLLGGEYRGLRQGGTAPRDIGIIYYEIVDALKSGDTKTASRKLGWIAHFLCDISQPFHVSNASQEKVIPGKYWHVEHVAFENDVDYYMKHTVGNPRKNWPADTEVAASYVPGLEKVTSDTSAQDVRLMWFGGTYEVPPAPGISARQLAIESSKKTRDWYATSALKVWATTWKPGYETDPKVRSSRGKGSVWLLENAPGMLSIGSTGLATLIMALSDPALQSTGIDHIKKPTISIKADKLSKAEAKKNGKYTATFTIRDSNGKALSEFPVQVKWRDEGTGGTLKSQWLWTDKNGKVTATITVAKKSKAYNLSASVSAPTSDYRSEVKQTVKVAKK